MAQQGKGRWNHSCPFTLAKYVSKPKGAKPGTVAIKKETVIKVRAGIPIQE
jgi:predicted ribosome quality control (RQC) complex YloA/Tae2 family protein